MQGIHNHSSFVSPLIGETIPILWNKVLRAVERRESSERKGVTAGKGWRGKRQQIVYYKSKLVYPPMKKEVQHRARMAACHVADPGSIPGEGVLSLVGMCLL